MKSEKSKDAAIPHILCLTHRDGKSIGGQRKPVTNPNQLPRTRPNRCISDVVIQLHNTAITPCATLMIAPLESLSTGSMTVNSQL